MVYVFSAAVIPESIEYDFPHIPTLLFFSWAVWVVLGIVSFIVARKASIIPGKVQVLFEWCLEWIMSLADDIIGKEKAKRYYPFFFGLFLFILVGNFIGLIPGFVSPTSDPYLTFGLAILVFFILILEGIRINGLRFFKQFAPPPLPWYYAPVSILIAISEIISFLMRPVSLGLRLFCNIFSKEMFLGILAMLILQFFLSHDTVERLLIVAPIVLRPFILLLGMIVSFIQAFVFLILSILYIHFAVNISDHGEEKHSHA